MAPKVSKTTSRVKKTKTKTVYLKMHFWRSDGGTGIFLAADLPTFAVLVRKDGSKQSGHPSLWRELDKYLKQRKR
jgi:hypothetical protein